MATNSWWQRSLPRFLYLWIDLPLARIFPRARGWMHLPILLVIPTLLVEVLLSLFLRLASRRLTSETHQAVRAAYQGVQRLRHQGPVQLIDVRIASERIRVRGGQW
jgi:hypothetical protein